MARVTVTGGANVDIRGRAGGAFVAGTSNPGQVTVEVGGVGRNIAAVLSMLGVETALVACVGQDAHGELIRSTTAAAGVDVSRVEIVGAPTGVYLAVLDDKGELASAVNDMRAIDFLTPQRLERHLGQLDRSDMIVADCNLPLETLRSISGLAGKTGKRLLIEPVSVSKSRKLLDLNLCGVDAYVTPNRQQLAALTGKPTVEQGIAELKRLGFGHAVVHAGRDGAYACGEAEEMFHVPSLVRGPIADVTGAGDAAVGGLVFGMVSGFAFNDALRLGQAAAALKLSQGAVSFTRDSVLALAGMN